MPERRSAASRRTTTKGGRVTPKGGASSIKSPGPGRVTPSARYTPPVPRSQKVSPMWVPVLMFALLGLGVMVIILNYLNLLPGDASNKYLVLGMALITGGFITATNYH